MLNPFDISEIPYKIIVYGIVLALTATFGAIGGCEYKQREWDKDKLAASEAARKLEKSDNSAGHRKIEQLGEDKITISEAQKLVKDALAGAPKKLVSCGKLEVTKVIAEVKPGEKIEKKVEEKDDSAVEPIYLLPGTMQLYDLSVDPSNVGLRGSTYGNPEALEINEGFEIIFENNFSCATERSKLKRLQERICEKQKLFSQPISKFCVS